MLRLSHLICAAALTLLPRAAHADEPAIDLVANPDRMQGIVLPRLVDAVLVNSYDAQQHNERGKVRLTFTVGTDGAVTDVKVTGPSRYWRLNDAAVASVLSRAYAPATRDGVPVAVRIWAIDNFNADPAEKDTDIDPSADADYACRYGTHHIAVDACSAVLVAHPMKAREVLLPRAHAYQLLGMHSKAIADFDRLIGFKPDDPDLYRARGFSYESLGQYDRAIADYNSAIAHDPKNVVYYYDRGFANERAGMRAAAMADFAAALEHRPQCEVVSIRGIGGDFAPPPHAFEENAHAPTMEQSPFHDTKGGGPGSGLSGQVGHTGGFGRVQDPTAGKIAVTTPETCKPSWVLPLTGIAAITDGQPDEMQRREYRCWARAVWNEQLDAALADCNRAVQLNPGFVRAYATRGLVYTRMGNTAAAAKDFNTALNMNPRLASALYLRGLGKAQAGDTTGAETDILAARTIDPEIASTYARYNLSP